MKTNNLLDLRSAQVLTKSELQQIKGGDEVCVCMVNGVVVGSIYSYDSTSCSELCKQLHGDNAEVKKEQVVDTTAPSPFV
ncbi:MAG: bacteriocin [Odoribacter sp.]|nr:bacteriocin [Odoribacter sp.]